MSEKNAWLSDFLVWKSQVLELSRSYYKQRSESWMLEIWNKVKVCHSQEGALKAAEEFEVKHGKSPWLWNPKENLDKMWHDIRLIVGSNIDMPMSEQPATVTVKKEIPPAVKVKEEKSEKPESTLRPPVHQQEASAAKAAAVEIKSKEGNAQEHEVEAKDSNVDMTPKTSGVASSSTKPGNTCERMTLPNLLEQIKALLPETNNSVLEVSNHCVWELHTNSESAFESVLNEAKEHPELPNHVAYMKAAPDVQAEEEWVFGDLEGDPVEDMIAFAAWLVEPKTAPPTIPDSFPTVLPMNENASAEVSAQAAESKGADAPKETLEAALLKSELVAIADMQKASATRAGVFLSEEQLVSTIPVLDLPLPSPSTIRRWKLKMERKPTKLPKIAKSMPSKAWLEQAMDNMSAATGSQSDGGHAEGFLPPLCFDCSTVYTETANWN